MLRDVEDGLSIEALDVIEARALAATPGQWWWVEGRDGTLGDRFIGRGGGIVGHPYLYLATEPGERVPPQDFDFIAHARQDVPSLVAEVRRLRRLVVDSEVRRRREAAAD